MASPFLCFISAGDKFLRKAEANCVPFLLWTSGSFMPPVKDHASCKSIFLSVTLSFKKTLEFQILGCTGISALNSMVIEENSRHSLNSILYNSFPGLQIPEQFLGMEIKLSFCVPICDISVEIMVIPSLGNSLRWLTSQVILMEDTGVQSYVFPGWSNHPCLSTISWRMEV